MPSKNYYVILGISPDESQSGIRSAFRDLARQHHPDRAGTKATRRFQEISEAYNVLSNRERRHAYDDGLRAAEQKPPVYPITPESRSPVEPLDPGTFGAHRARRIRGARRRLSLLEDFVAPYSVRDEILEYVRRNFTDEWMPKSGRLDALNIGIHMTREEALRGAEIELGVPVFFSCPRCHGTGRLGLYSCTRCRESGLVLGEEHAILRIPPMVADGTLFRIPLRGLGIRNLYLNALIRVGY